MEVRDIEKLAELARIDLSDDEKKDLLKDVDEILEFVGQIQLLDKEVDFPIKQVGALRNVMRDDEEGHEPEAFTKELLQETPRTEKGYVKVKKIL